MTIELEAPKSMANSNGKYLLPFNGDGELTDWTNKALGRARGAAVGEKAGSAKKKGKQGCRCGHGRLEVHKGFLESFPE